ncbi:MAG: serine hydrolase domain-containing protein [Pseudomonadota bacterium]
MKRFKQLVNEKWLQRIDVPEDLSTCIGIDVEGEKQASDIPNSSELQHRIWQKVEMLFCSGMYPTIAFCLRFQGKIILNRSLGYANNCPGLPDSSGDPIIATPNTPICLFSASKVITAVLIHMFVEQGKIDLQSPIGDYLPLYPQSDNHPTVLQLLSHQAGIPKWPLGESKSEIFNYDYMVKLAHSLEAQWTAGEQVGYHALTSGYLLGEILRQVSGKDLPLLLHEMLSKPLNMDYLSYGLHDSQASSAARNYFTGLPVLPPFSTILNPALGMAVEEIIPISNQPEFLKSTIPAGNVFSTAEEINRLFQMLLDGGSWQGVQILKPETLEFAIKEQNSMAMDYVLKMPMRYSAGFMLGENPISIFGPMTRQAFGHLGFTNNLCWADQQRQTSVSILTTGKPVLGPHIPKFISLLAELSRIRVP